MLWSQTKNEAVRAWVALWGALNPFRAPEPLPILNPSNFVPKYGFPVVKGLNRVRGTLGLGMGRDMQKKQTAGKIHKKKKTLENRNMFSSFIWYYMSGGSYVIKCHSIRRLTRSLLRVHTSSGLRAS